MTKSFLFILLSVNLFVETFAFNIINFVNKTDKWKIKIDNTSRNVYYDWLNKEWYNNNYNIVLDGDLHGKNSIRNKKM